MRSWAQAEYPVVVFLIAFILVSHPSDGLAASRGIKTATDVTFRGTCQFSVSVRRFLLSSRRQVEASVEVRNLVGTARFDLDRPFRARLGVHHLAFEVRVEDEHGTVVERLSSTVHDGMQSLSMSLRFPAPGLYRLILDEAGIDAAPARVALRPQSSIVMQVVAGTPSMVTSLRVPSSPSDATAIFPGMSAP